MLDAAPGQADDQAAAATGGDLGRQGRDGHVGGAVEHRGGEHPEVGRGVLQVAVDEEQGGGPRSGGVGDGIRPLEVAHPAHAGLERGGLAAVALVPDDVGPGGPGGVGGAVGAAVVDHDDPAHRGRAATAATVAAMRSASSLHGTTAATRAASALISGG